MFNFKKSKICILHVILHSNNSNKLNVYQVFKINYTAVPIRCTLIDIKNSSINF